MNIIVTYRKDLIATCMQNMTPKTKSAEIKAINFNILITYWMVVNFSKSHLKLVKVNTCIVAEALWSLDLIYHLK